MTSKDDWLFRAESLREAANRLRFNAAQLVAEAKRFDELAEKSILMALKHAPDDVKSPPHPEPKWTVDKSYLTSQIASTF